MTSVAVLKFRDAFMTFVAVFKHFDSLKFLVKKKCLFSRKIVLYLFKRNNKKILTLIIRWFEILSGQNIILEVCRITEENYLEGYATGDF